jgi:hypothetical protein
MRRHPDGARRLDGIGVLERTKDGVHVVPATDETLGDLLATRGVEPPW